MKKCPTCGNTYPDDCNFCNNCGVELVEQPTPQPQEAQTLVENVTPITPSVLKAFYRRTKKLGILCTVLGGVFCFLWLVWFLFDAEDYDLSGLLVLALVLACGIVLLRLSDSAVKNNKTVTEDTLNVYHFLENEIYTLEFRGKDKRGEKRLYYTEIVSVQKADNYYRIQFGGMIWLVCCDGFTVGTEEQFCRILREKCPKGVVRF